MRKAVLFVFCLFVIAASIESRRSSRSSSRASDKSSDKTPVVSPRTCDLQSNSFLGWLKKANPSACLSKSQPKGPWKVCDSTWKAAGSCCDSDSLLNTYERVYASSNKWWRSFGSLISTAYSGIKKGSQGGYFFSNDKIKQFAKNKRCPRGWSEASVSNIVSFSNEYLKDFDRFKQNSPVCFSAMARFRSESFCSGCSADNSGNSNFNAASFLRDQIVIAPPFSELVSLLGGLFSELRLCTT